jgi:hypothetical protein
MPETLKDKEFKSSFLAQSKPVSEIKSEMDSTFDIAGGLGKVSRMLDGSTTLPQMKKSAARIRLRLCKGRGIF